MKVLVTGSRGYIGSVLVPMLVNRGHETVGLDTDYYRRCTFSGSVPDIPTLIKDIRDIEEDDVADFDAIIHLAGLSNDPLSDYHPSLTFEINEKGSINLAQKAKEMGVRRFLFASSCSTYGAGGTGFLKEDAPFNPVTPYGISKMRVEQALTLMADDRFCPTYIRASTAYGLSPRIRFDLVTNNLTAWAFTTGRVYLKSDGSAWRPIVHVEDISRAYVAALEAPIEQVHNEAFNVGTTTENYQIHEIAEAVKVVVPNCDLAYASDAGADKRCYRVDCNKIARVLHGFKPQWTMRHGIEQLYQEYKNHNLSPEEFEGPSFKRIEHIKSLISDRLLDENLRWTGSATTSEH